MTLAAYREKSLALGETKLSPAARLWATCIRQAKLQASRGEHTGGVHEGFLSLFSNLPSTKGFQGISLLDAACKNPL